MITPTPAPAPRKSTRYQPVTETIVIPTRLYCVTCGRALPDLLRLIQHHYYKHNGQGPTIYTDKERKP